MIHFRQITNADEILALNDYYTLAVQGDPELSSADDISSFSMMHVLDGEITNEAVVPIDRDADEDSAYSEGKVASGLSRLLIGSSVISEPVDLSLLRAFLDRFGYEGEIAILPAAKLCRAVFPDLKSETPEQIALELGLEVNEPDAAIRSVTVLDALFRICRREMGGSVPEPAERVGSPAPEPVKSRQELQKEAPAKKRISTKKLRRMSEDIWKTSPWIFAAIAAVVLLLVIVLILPKKQEAAVDRNEAPVNYLVLSWNDPGKYGTKPRSGSGASDAVQFRIPYGVYNILNNNSIPVEVEIIKEGADLAKLKESDAEIETASELSAGNSGEEEEDSTRQSEYMKVTIRPNSSRQVTVDEGQYLTLSENAENLVLFYLSPVPDEPVSDTTGQVSAMQTVVYAYVKGTEVRFRKAPSLEGQVIDSLNDGQQVQVLAVTGEWTHVQVGDQKGYIFSQYLSSEDPAAVKKPETEQTAAEDPAAASAAKPAASAAPSASPAPAASPSPTPTPAPTSTPAAASKPAASSSSSSAAASADRPSNAIENSPLANSSLSSSSQAVTSADDDVIVSASGPTGDAGAAQAALATPAVSVSEDPNKPKDPSQIPVPANEYPTSEEPTAVE